MVARQLFVTSEARVDVLNRSAGTFAHMLQSALLDDVQLGLVKLGDPATTRIKGMAFENLTLLNLCQLVAASGALAAEVPPLLFTYDNACAKAGERRNNVLLTLICRLCIGQRYFFADLYMQ